MDILNYELEKAKREYTKAYKKQKKKLSNYMEGQASIMDDILKFAEEKSKEDQSDTASELEKLENRVKEDLSSAVKKM